MNDRVEKIGDAILILGDDITLYAEVLRLRRENAGLKEFAMKIAERVFLAHEVLARLAERKK